MIKPIGVTMKKNIMLIIIGEIIIPKKNPTLNQSLFNGVRILELISPKIRRIKDIEIDQILISPP
tara:strand:+ start:133 stop:327 length:195 start_codon:yes stop_codon:yes gene_type:complete